MVVRCSFCEILWNIFAYHFRINPWIQSTADMFHPDKCPMSHFTIRSSFIAKTFCMETFVPTVYWSPRHSQPSSGAYMGSTPGKTREPLRETTPAWRNGRHRRFWLKDPPVRAATCEFFLFIFGIVWSLWPSTAALIAFNVVFFFNLIITLGYELMED